MQRLPSRGDSSRPHSLQTTKSFSRHDTTPSVPTPPRTRAYTLQAALPSPINPIQNELPSLSQTSPNSDIFESQDTEAANDATQDDDPGPDAIDDLPIEIQSLVESFLESLGARVHATPLSVDRLSQLFQDFYVHAQAQIDTHVAYLAVRFPSEQVHSPTPSVSSVGSKATRAGARRNLKSDTNGTARVDTAPGNHQMLTASEITGRRKARRQLDFKRLALEEAVERVVCERVYTRIWRHRTSDDEERDEKLRSRAAALALVGVDLRELLSTAMSGDADAIPDLRLSDSDDAESARTKLAGARQNLEAMNDEKYPLAKLKLLRTAHKSIVETLQQLFPSTSSADEVLPTLIYSIITSSPETMHVVSNFNFIQRFRASGKVDGEAAYCLTNFEAAITFLETVDLSSIRRDEVPEGPGRSNSRPTTPRVETPDPMYHGLPSHPDSPFSSEKLPGLKDRPTPPNSIQPRRLSLLTQSRPNPFEGQGDAVLKAADDAFDTIHSALGGSFKFLFGRIKEIQATSSPHGETEVVAPKTLEDAHKLVSSTAHLDGDDISIGGSSTADQLDDSLTERRSLDRTDNSARVLSLIGGRLSRERSVDSIKSGDSPSRKVSFADGTENTPKSAVSAAGGVVGAKPKSASPRTANFPTTAITAGSFTAPSAYTAVESMRNLGNSLNPLRGFTTGMGMMRGFGRSPSGSIPTVASTSQPDPMEQADADISKEKGDENGRGQFDMSGVAPPIERFFGLKDSRELNGFEVDLLLRDYQRLGGVLRALGRS